MRAYSKHIRAVEGERGSRAVGYPSACDLVTVNVVLLMNVFVNKVFIQTPMTDSLPRETQLLGGRFGVFSVT